MSGLWLRIKWHFFWWFNYFALTFWLQRRGVFADDAYQLEQWGSQYGGWYVPYNLLKKNWVYYCVGVGQDISFDLRLTERAGATVHMFDPTPASKEFVKQYASNKKLKFHPVGIWNKDATMSFAPPLNEGWTSHSIVDLQGTKGVAFKAKCKRLKTVMKELGHSKIDLLKLDISGAEYEVLEDMFASKIAPKVLLIEFDQPTSVFRTYAMIMRICNQGYDLAIRSMWDFAFIKK